MRHKTELRSHSPHPTASPSQPSGLTAKNPRRSAGSEPALDDLSHRTTLGFCCRSMMQTRSASRQASAGGPLSLPCQQQTLVRLPPGHDLIDKIIRRNHGKAVNDEAVLPRAGRHP